MPPSGSATSSRRASSRREMSTLDQLSMFSHPTFAATPGATSSPASASGTTLSASPAGPRTGPSGPAPAPANLSPRQAAEAGLLTSGTSGRPGRTSSASADLQRSLANRLRARTASTGSTLFTLTWTALATPSGLLICALRASARRTSGSAPGSWPTPTVSRGDYQNKPDGRQALKLPGAARLAAWPTPQANDGTGANSPERQERRRSEAPKRKGGGPPGFANLRDAAQLAGWATPASKEAGGTPEQFLARKEKARANGAELGVSLTSLSMQVQLATWATPASRDFRTPNLRSFEERGGGAKGQQLNNQVVHSGPALTGSSAEIAAGARLNPAHSRWLQALPPAWDACAPTATRSARKPPRPS